MTEPRLTEKGASTALGVVSAICHGHSLEQAAALNDLEDADAVKVMLWMITAQAGILPYPEFEDDDE